MYLKLQKYLTPSNQNFIPLLTLALTGVPLISRDENLSAPQPLCYCSATVHHRPSLVSPTDLSLAGSFSFLISSDFQDFLFIDF
jgi:hypothetical protein